MFSYKSPDSPKSFIGREDFLFIGKHADPLVTVSDSRDLFRLCVYPMRFDGNSSVPVSHASLGMNIIIRPNFRLYEDFGLNGPNSTSAPRLAHRETFGTEFEPYNAIIQAAGVLAVMNNEDLIMELCRASNFRSVNRAPDIIPSFAAKLESLIYRKNNRSTSTI